MSTNLEQKNKLGAVASGWLLKNRSFGIEYDTFLSNHLTHAAVALDRLGVAPHLINKWCTAYSKKLEPVQPSLADAQAYTELDDSNWVQYIGQRDGYLRLLQFFDTKVAEHTWKSAVKKYLPKIMHNLASSAMHGMIHLGFGVKAGSPVMVAEGLAYLATGSCPFQLKCAGTVTDKAASKAPASSPSKLLLAIVTDALKKDKRGRSLVEEVLALQQEHSGLKQGNFQERMAVFTHGSSQRVTQMVQEAFKLEIPADAAGRRELVREISLMVAIVYMHTGNDFLIVHGATSWFAVQACLDIISEPRSTKEEEKQAVEVQAQLLRYWFAAFCGVYVIENLVNHDEVAEALTNELAHARLGPKETGDVWPEIVAAVAEEEDEHCCKMVYMLKDQWSRYGQLKLFVDAARAMAKQGSDLSFNLPAKI